MNDRNTPATPRDRDDSTRRPGRFARFFVEKGWVYLVLLSGSGIFLFPLIWLLTTSLKTDEELLEDRLLPAIPEFRAKSPYVASLPDADRPEGCPPAAWQAIYPQACDMARAALGPVPLPVGCDAELAAPLREAAAKSLAGWATARLPAEALRDAETAKPRLAEEIARANLPGFLAGRMSRLEVLRLQLRTLDARIVALDKARGEAGDWRVESGPARLIATPSGHIVAYDFAQAREPVVLARTFTMPCDWSELHKLVLSVQGDASWHRLSATIDVGKQRWVSQRETWVAQNRAQSLVFQPPSFEDDTFKARSWVPMALELDGAQGIRGEGSVLRVTLTPSSTASAIVGKAKRNYWRAFWSVPFWTYVGNSLLLVVLTVSGACFSATFVAYAFARLNWPGRGVAFMVLLATMMLPPQVTMVPSFLVWRELGWYNTLNPLWVPAWFGSAFFIFLMVQHMRTIPRELEESARMDGLSILQTWWYIIVPQVKAPMAAIAIMSFMGAWNDFMGPLIYLRDQAKFPLSLGLFGMRVDQGGDWTMMMAGNMLLTLPVIGMFFLFQRHFIQGMTTSGMKA